MRRINSRDVARRAGVSQSTVSRVLNNNFSDKIPISQETIERVTKVVEELGYEPNLAARSLRTRQTSMIGVLFDDILSSLSHKILEGIYATTEEAGFHILIQSSGHRENRTKADIARDQECLRWFQAQQVEGIIVVDSRANVAHPEDSLNSGGLPIIFVNRYWNENPPHAFVYPDDRGGGQMATRHLIDLGHQKIGYINGPAERCTCSSERLLGFQDALREAGLEMRPEWVVRGDWRPESGYNAAKQIFRHGERPTALFVANDYMAVGCIRAVQELGIRVPEDLAIVGFDNREAATYVEPPLTTVTLPGDAMGRLAAEMMIDATRKKQVPITGRQVPSRLLIRNSCGSGTVSPGSWLWQPTS
jgi:LacI family transcriptional regulator